ncbi:peptidase S41 family protein, partial [Geosmithia morbida]
SVPLGKQAALDLVDAIEPYLEWQSDAAYLKNPPQDYFYPGFDLFENLSKVRANLEADKYDGEYDFMTDLYETVFLPGHDGHYLFYPDILSRAFKWSRQRSLVSISEDGTSLPVIKLYEDIITDPATAPEVTKINGVDASRYVEETINKGTYNQDVDSAYNSMFYSKAGEASAGITGYFAGSGRISMIYQGPTTTFTFSNGTDLTLENEAQVIGDMTGVVDGTSFYEKFCTPQQTAESKVQSYGDAQPSGYPKPVISTSDSIVSGYYLEGEGLEDVAVIALLAFESASPVEFQAVTRDFLAEAKAAGKTKLVVDFQYNGGGYILLGYDFFRQLFPHILEDGFSRWKENGAFDAISDIVSKVSEGVDPYTSDDSTLIALYQSWFNYRYDLNETYQPFETFDDKFSPHIYENTPYTNLMRWNLSDPLTTRNATYGLGTDISGYGVFQNLTQPFAAEDIVLLYDGVCASTCSIASEMLRIQGKVKSVAFGGRPKEGAIQGAGGVKGSQVLQFGDILEYARVAANLTTDEEHLAELERYTELPIQRATAANVNVRDQILRDNLDDGVPAQFVTEEADCRLYWTADMIADVSKIWEAAANSAFNGAKCAHGAISRPLSSGSATVSASSGSGVSYRPPVSRLSDSVDKTPFKPTKEWAAFHQQKVEVA